VCHIFLGGDLVGKEKSRVDAIRARLVEQWLLKKKAKKERKDGKTARE